MHLAHQMLPTASESRDVCLQTRRKSSEDCSIKCRVSALNIDAAAELWQRSRTMRNFNRTASNLSEESVNILSSVSSLVSDLERAISIDVTRRRQDSVVILPPYIDTDGAEVAYAAMLHE